MALYAVLHFGAAAPDDDRAIRSLVVELAGGFHRGLCNGSPHRGRLESRDLTRMTCAALLLSMAGERENSNGRQAWIQETHANSIADVIQNRWLAPRASIVL